MALTKVSRGLLSTGIVDNSTTTAITIDSSENVGIGASPATQLFVKSASNAANVFAIESADASQRLQFGVNTSNGGSYIFEQKVQALRFGTSDTERMRITSAGAVELTGPGGAGETFLNFTADSNTLKAQISGAKEGANGGTLSFSTNNSSGTLTEAMRIDSSGNVEMRGSANVRISLGTAGTSGANNNSNWIYGNGTNLRFNNAGGFYSWETLGTERMRLSGGNLLVGTTTAAPSSTTTIKGSLGMVGPSGVSTAKITFNNPSNVKYWGIDTDQNYLYITDADFSHYAYVGQNMTSWSFASDRRLKENIVDVPYGLGAVMAMQPRAFKFKSSGVETIGFVAQELQAVVPEAVTGTEVEYLDDDTPQEKANKSLGVSKDTLIPVLVKAIQEQQATIEALTTRLTALENN